LKSSFGNKQFSSFQQKSILLEKLSIRASPAVLVIAALIAAPAIEGATAKSK
jgi:hypothetical protein